MLISATPVMLMTPGLAIFYGGLLTGKPIQILAVTWILLKFADTILGLRVKEKEEEIELDLALHEEEAYT